MLLGAAVAYFLGWKPRKDDPALGLAVAGFWFIVVFLGGSMLMTVLLAIAVAFAGHT